MFPFVPEVKHASSIIRVIYKTYPATLTTLAVNYSTHWVSANRKTDNPEANVSLLWLKIQASCSHYVIAMMQLRMHYPNNVTLPGTERLQTLAPLLPTIDDTIHNFSVERYLWHLCHGLNRFL